MSGRDHIVALWVFLDRIEVLPVSQAHDHRRHWRTRKSQAASWLIPVSPGSAYPCVGSRWSSALQLKSASPKSSASVSSGEKVLTSFDIDFFDVIVEYPAAGPVFRLDIILR
jgi:hypothetical protein